MINCPKNFQELSTFETELSDFHKMVLTVLKSEAPNLTPKVVSYRKYKHFNGDKFKLEILDKLSMQNLLTMDYKNFKDTIIDSLNKHAPLKRKYLRANHSNFITKELSKAIMQRSKLRNLYLKIRSDEKRIRYKKQRNICVTTLSNDIPTKIIQQFSKIFTDFIYNNFNSYLESRIFPDELKLAEVVPVYNKNDKRMKVIIDPSAFFRIYKKFTKDLSKRN